MHFLKNTPISIAYHFTKGDKMLVCKNVIVNGRRTSMRLDQEIWQSLADICHEENITIHQLCSKIDLEKKNSGLSGAVRLFVLNYLKHLLKQYKV